MQWKNEIWFDAKPSKNNYDNLLIERQNAKLTLLIHALPDVCCMIEFKKGIINLKRNLKTTHTEIP